MTESADKLIGTFRKNAREEVRVMLRTYKGADLADVRAWYKDPEGNYRPGKDGLAVRVEQLPLLLELMQSAVQRARDEGLLG
jgi:hypothetical protein